MKRKTGRKYSRADYDIMEKFGEIVLHHRKSLRLTRLKFANIIGVVGETVRQIELGKQWPKPALLIKLAIEVRQPLDDLLNRRSFERTKKNGDIIKVS